jgi:hypothetical protein
MIPHVSVNIYASEHSLAEHANVIVHAADCLDQLARIATYSAPGTHFVIVEGWTEAADDYPVRWARHWEFTRP